LSAPTLSVRPSLALGESLIESLHLFTEAFPGLLLSVAVFSFPLQLLTEGLVEREFGPAESWRSVLLYLLLGSITSPFLSAAAVIAANAQLEGETLSPGRLLRRAAGNWYRVLNVQVLSGLLIALGAIAFFVPGILMLGRFALVDSIAVIERRPTGRCLDRSRELVKGATGRVLLLYVLFELPVLATASLGGLLTAKPPFSGFVFTALASSVDTLAGMLMYVGMFVVYRTRSGG
jgi:hypothetical protein